MTGSLVYAGGLSVQQALGLGSGQLKGWTTRGTTQGVRYRAFLPETSIAPSSASGAYDHHPWRNVSSTATTMPKPKILTYIDAGTVGGSHLMRAIAQQLVPAAHEFQAVMADDLRQDPTLFDDAVLFVMPGGADLPYCEALNGAPNQRIRRFVEEGGVYLGVCAGAYYACRELAFHAGMRGAICGTRELSFVDAVAVGSLPELTGGIPYDATPRTAAATGIRTTDCLSAVPLTPRVHYHGGCRFDFADPASPAARILAVYTEIEAEPPVIVSASVGQGKAILSGVHLEISERECKEALREHSDMAAHVHVCDRLAETGNERLEVFRLLLAHAGLELRQGRWKTTPGSC
ncbi:BPL-N domain-containing protein [Cupriavidus basilensis]|uniref:BPL-N domain-containing protein n=1 Tax=Cupriavidus basilensis TaxID=68895 RepID=A0ABT6AIB0_9BURK|nr:BPL-N domain-containing protein [Cupriavidus basilensis]MDF3832335.1 BPL-N domain-containing protein [Cupriavidus basilensis]